MKSLDEMAEAAIVESYESELPPNCIPSDMTATAALCQYMVGLYKAGFLAAIEAASDKVHGDPVHEGWLIRSAADLFCYLKSLSEPKVKP